MCPFEDHERKSEHVHHFGPQEHPHVRRDAKRRRAGEDATQHWQGEGEGREGGDQPRFRGRTLMNVRTPITTAQKPSTSMMA